MKQPWRLWVKLTSTYLTTTKTNSIQICCDVLYLTRHIDANQNSLSGSLSKNIHDKNSTIYHIIHLMKSYKNTKIKIPMVITSCQVKNCKIKVWVAPIAEKPRINLLALRDTIKCHNTTRTNTVENRGLSWRQLHLVAPQVVSMATY